MRLVKQQQPSSVKSPAVVLIPREVFALRKAKTAEQRLCVVLNNAAQNPSQAEKSRAPFPAGKYREAEFVFRSESKGEFSKNG